MKIGFVTIWFERGQAYVTQTLRKALMATSVPEIDLYVLARTGGVYGQPMLDQDNQWAVPNLAVYPEYQINPNYLTQWITKNQLDVVVFNEEYDWNLVGAAKATGAKVITYLDFYHPDWASKMGQYDAVWCASNRTLNMVRGVCNAHYIGWAVDLELFKPGCPYCKGKGTVPGLCPDRLKFSEGIVCAVNHFDLCPVCQSHPPHLFFHNAGWFGINMRKGTPSALVAYDAIKHLPGASMLVHQQLELKQLMPELYSAVKNLPGLYWHTGTVRAPGLYHRGKVLVMPTKMEGLGLPLFEALACGLPVITTNEPPMNEYIVPGVTGWLVRVKKRHTRTDGLAFPECEVDVQHLAEIMTMVYEMEKDGILGCASSDTRHWAEQNLQLKDLGMRVLAML